MKNEIGPCKHFFICEHVGFSVSYTSTTIAVIEKNSQVKIGHIYDRSNRKNKRKAFCSLECICQLMLMDDQADNWPQDILKSNNYSASPCSAPMSFSPSIIGA